MRLARVQLGPSFLLLSLLAVVCGQVALGAPDLADLLALDDSVRVESSRVGFDRRTGQFSTTITTTNISADVIPAPAYLVIESITSALVTVANADGLTVDGKPYFVLLESGQLAPGGNTSVRVAFSNPQRVRFNFAVRAYGSPTIVRIVECLRTKPETVLVGEPTTVTVTVEIGADAELIMDQVYLLQLNGAGTVQENLGRMYDDGTHGDSSIGDGTFTTQVLLDESSPVEVRLVVQAAYAGPPDVAHSDTVTVYIVNIPSQSAIEEVHQISREAAIAFANLAPVHGDETARQMVLDSLTSNPNVLKAELCADGTTISITFDSGHGNLQTFVATGPPGLAGTPTSNEFVTASFYYPVVDNVDYDITRYLNRHFCLEGRIFERSEFTLDVVANEFEKSGLILISSHGWVAGEDPNFDPIAIMTGEEVDSDSAHRYIELWDKRQVTEIYTAPDWDPKAGTGYWSFKPSYVEAECTGLPNSLVIASACQTLMNDKNTSMADAFLNNDAAAYVGWTESVCYSFANGIVTTLCERLLDGDTLEEAYFKWTVAERTDPICPNEATLSYRGDGTFKLPSTRGECLQNMGIDFTKVDITLDLRNVHSLFANWDGSRATVGSGFRVQFSSDFSIENPHNWGYSCSVGVPGWPGYVPPNWEISCLSPGNGTATMNEEAGRYLYAIYSSVKDSGKWLYNFPAHGSHLVNDPDYPYEWGADYGEPDEPQEIWWLSNLDTVEICDLDEMDILIDCYWIEPIDYEGGWKGWSSLYIGEVLKRSVYDAEYDGQGNVIKQELLGWSVQFSLFPYMDKYKDNASQIFPAPSWIFDGYECKQIGRGTPSEYWQAYCEQEGIEYSDKYESRDYIGSDVVTVNFPGPYYRKYNYSYYEEFDLIAAPVTAVFKYGSKELTYTCNAQ